MSLIQSLIDFERNKRVLVPQIFLEQTERHQVFINFQLLI
jgi:hypothetical protein